MLGELNWIFTAITDTIAWNTLPRGKNTKLSDELSFLSFYLLLTFPIPPVSLSSFSSSCIPLYLLPPFSSSFTLPSPSYSLFLLLAFFFLPIFLLPFTLPISQFPLPLYSVPLPHLPVSYFLVTLSTITLNPPIFSYYVYTE